MSDTPRTDLETLPFFLTSGETVYATNPETARQLERELNAAILNETIATNELHKAKERIAHLERELDLTSTQAHELKHQAEDAIQMELKAQERIRMLEIAHKQDLDDAIALAQQHLNSYHEAKERIKKLEEWIGELEVIASHAGTHDRREWHGDIGWLHPGQVAYVGEKKP